MIPSACYGRLFFFFISPAASIFPQPHSSVTCVLSQPHNNNYYYYYTYAAPCRILPPKADSKFTDPWFTPVNPSIMLTHPLQLSSPRRPVSSPAAADAVPATAASGVLWGQRTWLSHRLVSIMLLGVPSGWRQEEGRQTERMLTRLVSRPCAAASCARRPANAVSIWWNACAVVVDHLGVALLCSGLLRSIR